MIVCILLFSGCVVQKKEDKLKFKKIEITGGLLTPVFSSDNYEYTLYFEKNVNQIILGYEMEDGYEANIEQGEKYIYDGEEIKLYVKNGAEKGEEDKFILTLGEYNVSPIEFDTKEEAEKFLKENFKFNNFELSIIGAMCSQLNKLEQREKESYLKAKENAIKNN